MEKWSERSIELAYLINPAFSAILIYHTIKEYSKSKEEGMPFSLVYLVLPILLHKNTRERVGSKKNMVNWLQDNADILIGFSKRAKSLIDYTNEAIEFLLSRGVIKIVKANLQLESKLSQSKISEQSESDSEIKDCYKKAEHLGRWFVKMKTEENVYIAWGIRP